MSKETFINKIIPHDSAYKHVSGFAEYTDDIKEPKDFNGVLIKLLSSPNISNKNYVYQQYDSTVRTNTIIHPGGSAGVIRLKNRNEGT